MPIPGLLEFIVLAAYATPIVAIVLVVRWIQRRNRTTSEDERPAPTGDHWKR